MLAATAPRDLTSSRGGRRLALRIGLVLGAIAALPFGACERGDARQPADGAASERGSVVVYVSVDDAVARPILKDFESRTGISVRALTDTEATKTTGLVQRLRSEKLDARADLFWSGEVFQTIAMASENVLAPLPPDLLRGRPADSCDPGGRWAGMALRARVICYHTGRVSRDSAPRTLHNLLLPVYMGRVVMARPAFGTTRGHMAALVAAWGEDEASRWLRLMKANGLRLVDGNSAVVRAIAMGEADVGLTDTDDVESGRKLGWAVDMNIALHTVPGRETLGPLRIPSTVAIIAGGPNRAGAAKLAEFLLSPEIEEQMIRLGAASAAVMRESSVADPLHPLKSASMPTYEQIAEAMPRAMEICQRELGP